MDIKINYIEKGEGFPFILLHGNGESSEYFTNQIDYFSIKYRVIAIDTRGHGKTPRGEKPFTLKQFAEDLKDFFDELEISKAIILGFSDGANIAMIFALKYPNYVDKLILNGGDLNTKGVKAYYQIPIHIGYIMTLIISKFNKKAVKKNEMLSLMVNQPNILPKELEKLSMPMLVIAGKKDMIKESHTILIHKSIKNSELCIMEGDHFIAKKKPEQFNNIIKNFLENVQNTTKVD